ncbi:hypothetical protein EYF80_066898 [Liparis tanakae]|uniref:Uncharacterized protein n=1 Tax=Liparis tanakae TaxID=230148 RepID=A0A4Z2E2H5_9TELE|nr:hypothetical protein EYF80_066898 [Liparis tanakae]
MTCNCYGNLCSPCSACSPPRSSTACVRAAWCPARWPLTGSPQSPCTLRMKMNSQIWREGGGAPPLQPRRTRHTDYTNSWYGPPPLPPEEPPGRGLWTLLHSYVFCPCLSPCVRCVPTRLRTYRPSLALALPSASRSSRPPQWDLVGVWVGSPGPP